MIYQSALRQNGLQQVAVNLGNVRDAAEFELALAGPTVTLDAPSSVRRAGSAVDTPLALLQPAVLPLTAVVTWPNDQSRQLTEIVFLVDGVAQPQAAPPATDKAAAAQPIRRSALPESQALTRVHISAVLSCDRQSAPRA